MSEERAVPALRIERLLQPISAAQPAGEWLRYEGTYEAIQTARREDDASLPQGIWEAPLKVADWGSVESRSIEALESRTKDAQIAGWLTEAWLHRHGISGLVEGLHLLEELVERYWDELWPRPEGDDLDYRLAPFEWLDDRIAHQLAFLPLTAPEGNLKPACYHADWKHAQQREAESRPEERHGRNVTLADFRTSASLTPPAFFRDLAQGLAEARQRTLSLAAALERRVGAREAPGLHRLREAFDGIEEVLRQTAPADALAPPPAPDAPAETGASGAAGEPHAPRPAPAAAPAAAHGPIRGRAEAYRALADAADYLMRTEPHSPAPYLVRRAIAWGSMSLAELLHELMRESADLGRVFELLGLPGPGERPDRS